MASDREDQNVTIYTDGACSGNPGPGGWGALLVYGDHERELMGGDVLTTNNRMELQAAIESLDALKRNCSISLYTDSKYVMDGITIWIEKWRENGWRTSRKKQPVKNADLWQALDLATQRHQIAWHWVRGHTGHDGNERADELARMGMAPYKD